MGGCGTKEPKSLLRNTWMVPHSVLLCYSGRLKVNFANLFSFNFFSEQPEEMSQIRELEEQVETLKAETRNRLLQNIDKKYAELGNLRSLHEREIETMTRQIGKYSTLQKNIFPHKMAIFKWLSFSVESHH